MDSEFKVLQPEWNLIIKQDIKQIKTSKFRLVVYQSQQRQAGFFTVNFLQNEESYSVPPVVISMPSIIHRIYFLYCFGFRIIEFDANCLQ